ncbi:hypothetical protein ARTHRO9AX_150011 [Arthrobacter sp. 9AX]|nr:hypothetical protein ARTHRO9AX_150011 [Arthrobacter sp. 9AX]
MTAATRGAMGAQESPPVRPSAAPVDGVALGRLLSLLVDGVSAGELESQLARDPGEEPARAGHGSSCPQP